MKDNKKSDLITQTCTKVKAMILSQELMPGEKLFQEDLARRLGVSRTPLLRALERLEQEMLVERVPRRGLFVKKMKMTDMLDAFDCREALEGLAARLAAERITKEQVRELQSLFAPFRKNPRKANQQAYRIADQRFHQRIIELSDNRMLIQISTLGNVLSISYQQGLIRPPVETLPEHRAIIQAMARHDSALAEKLMREHEIRTRQLIAKRLHEESQ
ncbi:MAG: GntR family transcriptional regulator [Sedimentisphaerales bacterium]|nr:GntR family transcriptional regulator [Sedimentisphaerales bacterium]